MFNLIPWKKRNNGGTLTVSQDRQDDRHPLAQLRSEFDSLWDRFWGDLGRGLGPWANDFGLGMHSGLEDRAEEYVFHAELPGFEPDEIEVKLSGSTLQVRAEHKEEQTGDRESSYRYGSFQRYFTLPHGVNDQQIDARYRSGVLEVHLPKTEQAKGKRISVNVR